MTKLLFILIILCILPLILSFSRYLKPADAYIHVKSNTIQKIKNKADKDITLTQYMRLPVDQYICVDIPLAAKLEKLKEGSNDFLLTVPPLNFFNLIVNPSVYAEVSQTDNSVIIESNKITLDGSQIVKELNGCYDVKVRTEFNWIDNDNQKCIISKSDIKVWVNPPAPFKYFPRSVLETTGNTVMNFALYTVETSFLRALGTDYEIWVIDEGYRLERAKGKEIALVSV